MRGRAAVALLAAAVAAGMASPAAHAKATVQIVNLHYKPTPLTVAVGETVTWKNEGFIPHTVTGAELDSGRIRGGGEFSYTFTKPGTFEYRCTIHPSMHGKVIVQGEASGGMKGMSGHEEHPSLPPTTPTGAAQVSLHLGKASSRHGVRSVSVSSSRPGEQVLLQVYSREHFSWIDIAHATLGADGKAIFKLRPRLHRQLRVVVLGAAGEAPSISKILRT
jgi:plastocyanin